MEAVTARYVDVHTDVTVDASRAKVHAAIVALGEWWPHHAHEEGTISLEPWVGGRFFESWSSGGVLYGRVARIEEGSYLALDGTLGVEGVMSGECAFRLDGPADGPTTVTLVHHVIGNLPDGADAGYRQGAEHALAALAAHLG